MTERRTVTVPQRDTRLTCERGLGIVEVTLSSRVSALKALGEATLAVRNITDEWVDNPSKPSPGLGDAIRAEDAALDALRQIEEGE